MLDKISCFTYVNSLFEPRKEIVNLDAGYFEVQEQPLLQMALFNAREKVLLESHGKLFIDELEFSLKPQERNTSC